MRGELPIFLRGLFGVETDMQRRNYIGVTRDDAFKMIMEYSHWRANSRLVRDFVDESASSIDWLQKQGVEFDGPMAILPIETPDSPAGLFRYFRPISLEITGFRSGTTYCVSRDGAIPDPLKSVEQGNKDSYNKLPADLKDVLDKSCGWAKNDALKYWSATLEDVKNYYEATGIEMVYLTGEEKQKFDSAYERTCDKIGENLDAKGYPGTEIVLFIRERVKHYTQ